VSAEESRAHVGEAIRHLQLAIDSASCELCRQLYDEEIAHLQMAEQLIGQAEDLAAVQSEKRAQLSESNGVAATIREPVREQETVLVARETSAPDRYRREGFIESLVRTRPRLSDLVPALGGDRR
jgi:hypothetical protein